NRVFLYPSASNQVSETEFLLLVSWLASPPSRSHHTPDPPKTRHRPTVRPRLFLRPSQRYSNLQFHSRPEIPALQYLDQNPTLLPIRRIQHTIDHPRICRLLKGYLHLHHLPRLQPQRPFGRRITLLP